MVQDKNEQIEKLSQVEVLSLIKTILEKKQYYNIAIHENCVYANQNSFYNIDAILFIFFPQRLGGIQEKEIESIGREILMLQNKYSANYHCI